MITRVVFAKTAEPVQKGIASRDCHRLFQETLSGRFCRQHHQRRNMFRQKLRNCGPRFQRKKKKTFNCASEAAERRRLTGGAQVASTADFVRPTSAPIPRWSSKHHARNSILPPPEMTTFCSTPPKQEFSVRAPTARAPMDDS